MLRIHTYELLIPLGEHLPADDSVRRRCVQFIQSSGGCLASMIPGIQTRPRPVLPPMPGLNLPSLYQPHHPPRYDTWLHQQAALPPAQQVCFPVYHLEHLIYKSNIIVISRRLTVWVLRGSMEKDLLD